MYDEKRNNNHNIEIKKKIISYKKIIKKTFDFIIISPGIDINKCKLKYFLKKNLKKINTDLDIFYNCYNKNKNITITGTNGKSTTAKLLYDILKDQRKDVRLVGNIGNPILLEKKIKKDTLFVIEASSYQLEYSQMFKANIAVILNISPDHLERHKSLQNYIKAKFKLIKNQKFLPKIIKVNNQIEFSILKKINNPLFSTSGNNENLSPFLGKPPTIQ